MEQFFDAHVAEFLILPGAFLLVLSWQDYRQGRVSTAGVVGWWTVDRDEAPGIFWALTMVQFGSPIICMLLGLYFLWRR